MKKLLVGLLILCIVFCGVGCESSTNPPIEQNNNSANNDSSDIKTEVALTSENIYEYLTISSDITDVEKKYLGADCSNADGKITIKTSPRKRGDFNNVTIQITLSTTSAGWIADSKWDSREKSLIIPFDGKYEEIFTIRSNVTEDFITTTPRFEIIINSVSGTFFEE